MTLRGFLGHAVNFMNNTIARAELSHSDSDSPGSSSCSSAPGQKSHSTGSLAASRVKELFRSQSADVARYPIIQRSDNSTIILYGPINDHKGSSTFSHVIILHIPAMRSSFENATTSSSRSGIGSVDRMFSIYRSNDETEAKSTFIQFTRTILTLFKADPRPISRRSMLEKLVKSLQEKQGWTAAHLAAGHNLWSYFEHPLLQEQVNTQAALSLKTPLHIAVEYKHVETARSLLDLGVNLDLVDDHENTVIHIGANKNVQILKLLLKEATIRSPHLIDMRNSENCTALHIACKNNHPDCVKVLLDFGADPNIPNNDSFPIHVAVKSRSSSSVQEIVNQNPEQLQFRDLKKGGTILHWAQGPDSISFLLSLGADPKLVNNKGRSVLHECVKRNEFKSVLLLLTHPSPPDPNLQDENGDTALHLAARLCSSSIIKTLIVFGANLDLLNNRGESSRHLVCTTNDLNITDEKRNAALFFLDRVGAKRCPEGFFGCSSGCSKEGDFDGVPPAHSDSGFKWQDNFNFISSSTSNLMEECLACFSINTEMRNANSIPAGVFSGSESRNNLNSNPATSIVNEINSKSPDLESSVGGRLLCLDGGGIRGLVLIQTLLVIQEFVGCPILELFDWVAGTSTGGILALGLGCGKSVLELQGLYFRFKDKVFQGGRPYKSEVMEEFLKKEFGERRTMNCINNGRPRIMIATAIADSRPAEFKFFRNYPSPQSVLNQFQHQTHGQAQSSSDTDFHSSFRTTSSSHFPPVEDDLNKYAWQVAKWTGSAPTYFQVDGRYIDGGVIANNPTLDALTELFQFSAAMRAVGDFKLRGNKIGSGKIKIPSVVLSLGCGIQPKAAVNTNNLDVSWPKGVIDAISTLPRIHTLVNLLADQATQTEGQVVERSRAWCSSIGVPFFRFSPQLPIFVDLDETKDEVLIDLTWTARAYLFANRNKIVELRQILIQRSPPTKQS